MNNDKFEMLAELLRIREPGRKAAELVLVQGKPKRVAGFITGASEKTIAGTIKRFLIADSAIKRVYGVGASVIPEKSAPESLDEKLNKLYPNAKNRQIVEFEGRSYIRRFFALQKNAENKVTEWGRSWEPIENVGS